MATWTYFTSYLDGSRPITKAERDELYDKLDAILGECSETLVLDATDQAAIKDSKLLTDLASLDDGGAGTIGTLHAVLEAASTAFDNYDSAVSAALSAEGISADDRDDILAARVDSYQLWNYYRRVIDALNCACTMPQAHEEVGPSSGYGLDEFLDTEVGPYFEDAHDLAVEFAVANPDGYARMKLYADDVEIWDSGCTNTGASDTVAVPAGTEEIKVTVEHQCSGTWADNSYEFTLTCV